jgi:hypothetical protein
MGNTTPNYVDDGPLEFEDEGQEGVRGGVTDGGTDDDDQQKPVRDDMATAPPTAEEVRWVIFVRGGGLYSYPAPVDEGGTGESSEVVIPGDGVTDPVDPQFFYEWQPTPDENQMGPNDPRVTDPAPPDEGSGEGAQGTGFGTFPLGGDKQLGVTGAPGGLTKNSTVHGRVLVESFKGVDASGRSTEGVFGGASILPLY